MAGDFRRGKDTASPDACPGHSDVLAARTSALSIPDSRPRILPASTDSATSRTRLALCSLGLLVGCSDATARATTTDRDAPRRGGTLEIVALSDLDHYATSSAYLADANWLHQLTSRQVLGYTPSPDNAVKLRPVGDLAREAPSLENGGISADGLTYTIHLRSGVRWNSSPPRALVAGDVVRGFEMLCNPVLPAGTLTYFLGSIAGMTRFCDDFAKVPGTAAAIRDFVNSRQIDGVRALDDSTVRFRLISPRPDFLNLLTLPHGSAIPAEHLDYLTDGPEFRQHLLSPGPYRIARYVPGRALEYERNPVWNRDEDPLRPAYVDRIRVRMGVDAQLQQLQIEAGTADLGAETVRGSDVGPLLASANPTIWLSPTGEMWANMTYLIFNRVGPRAPRTVGLRDVRRAIALAIDKAAIVQVYSGRRIARALRQPITSSVAGFTVGADAYVTPNDRGDASAARALLAKASYDGTRPLRLAYPIDGSIPMAVQVIQASLARAGIAVTLQPVMNGEYYGRLMPDIANARRGEWDLAIGTWYPDWFGETNGRSVFSALFDGRSIGANSANYGGLQSATVDSALDRASEAPTRELARVAWSNVARLLSDEVADVPLVELKTPFSKSRRVRYCTWLPSGINCDLNNLWLADAPRAEAAK
jgi:ABC-type transport system substrate-binding protein